MIQPQILQDNIFFQLISTIRIAFITKRKGRAQTFRPYQFFGIGFVVAIYAMLERVIDVKVVEL